MGAATLVHASVLKPLEEYVIDAEGARENLLSLPTPVLFHGHTHVPAYWALRGNQAASVVIDGRAQPLLSPALINVGSVGQPRDGDVRAVADRVGEMEQAVSALGFDTVVIARPSLLDGERAALGQPTRRGEQLALKVMRVLKPLIPRNYRAISDALVAKALVEAVQAGRPGAF